MEETTYSRRECDLYVYLIPKIHLGYLCISPRKWCWTDSKVITKYPHILRSMADQSTSSLFRRWDFGNFFMFIIIYNCLNYNIRTWRWSVFLGCRFHSMINPGFPVAHKCGCVDNNAVRESIPTLFSQPRSAPFYFWQAWYLTILEIHVNVLFFPTPFKLQFAERMVGSKFAHKAIVIITGANGYVKVCQARGSTILNFIVESATVYAKGFFYNFAGAFYPIVVHKHLHRVSQQVNQSKCDTLV